MNIKNLIIGFGKAGKTLAGFLAQKGEQVILVEQTQKMFGGTCINIGCIPTKSLIYQAKKKVEFEQAINYKNELTNFLRDKNFEKLSQSPNIKIIVGKASFLNENTIEVENEDGNTQEITAERIFINTGASPFIPNIEGIDLPKIYNSTTLMEIKELPKELAIVGGGFIGLEFASMFADFGSNVTILDDGEVPLPREDEDMRKEILKILTQKNIKFINKSNIIKFEAEKQGISIHHNGTTTYADAVLIATGRSANTSALKLENANIETNERGFIKVDDELKTNIKNIWALGDVNGGAQFTYISLDDYRLVKNQLSNGDYTSRIKRQDFAFSVFITPPYAHIGLREKDIDPSSLHIKVKTIPAGAIPKARILGNTQGLLKAIVDTKTEKILGCTLLCEEAHEMINIVKTIMDNNLSYNILKNQIFTHPSMSEVLNDLFDI